MQPGRMMFWTLRIHDGALAAGVLLLIIGASLVVANLAMSATPISDDERLRLVDQYNRSITPQP